MPYIRRVRALYTSLLTKNVLFNALLRGKQTGKRVYFFFVVSGGLLSPAAADPAGGLFLFVKRFIKIARAAQMAVNEATIAKIFSEIVLIRPVVVVSGNI